jgi:uncharacterized protein
MRCIDSSPGPSVDKGPSTLVGQRPWSDDAPMAGSGDRGVVIEVLTERECRSLLGQSNVGRVGVTINALPVVLPVNCAVFEDSVIFRTTPGTKLTAALHRAVVAFEVDDYDPDGDLGWSVLIRGRASEVTDPERIAQMRNLPLRYIAPGGEADHFVEIPMRAISGRRIRPGYLD